MTWTKGAPRARRAATVKPPCLIPFWSHNPQRVGWTACTKTEGHRKAGDELHGNEWGEGK